MAHFEIDIYGTDETHTPDHVVNINTAKVHGPTVYVLLCFSTQAVMMTESGLERVEPGDTALITPGFQEYHHSVPGSSRGFINDWAHIISSYMPAFIEDTCFPCNRIVHTGNPLFIRDTLTGIGRELLTRRDFYHERISLLIEMQLLEIARFYREKSRDALPYEDRLVEVRQRLLTEYADKWTVKKMADMLNLSPSYFSMLYKKQFYLSPMDDLINLRLQTARVMLSGSQKSLSRIAAECGFQNEYYFSKMFKAKIGVSPNRYRQ